MGTWKIALIELKEFFLHFPKITQMSFTILLILPLEPHVAV